MLLIGNAQKQVFGGYIDGDGGGAGVNKGKKVGTKNNNQLAMAAIDSLTAT